MNLTTQNVSRRVAAWGVLNATVGAESRDLTCSCFLQTEDEEPVCVFQVHVVESDL